MWGVETTLNIIQRIEKRAASEKYMNAQELNTILRDEIAALLTENNSDDVDDFEAPIAKKPYVNYGSRGEWRWQNNYYW